MDKQLLQFTANEQILTVDAPIRISTNKVNYIEAHFDLGQNWSGYDSVRAVWYNDFNCISTVLDANGVCAVPFEVMKRKGKVQVNLVGSISVGDVLTDRLTSYPVVAVIVDCTVQITGAETSPITPSQFDQYVAIVQALVGTVRDIDRIELNPGYTLTIYYSDGTSDTTSSIRGATGNGIASIAKTGSSGSNPVIDTYTVTYTDGNTFTFTVTNGIKGDTGNGISKIEKTGSSGTNPVIDTYRITYTNGQTFSFTVTNGVKGDTGNGIQSIYKTGESGAVKTYTILMTDGSTFDFDVTDGEVTQAVLDAAVEEINSDIYESTIVQVKSDTEPYHYRRTNNGQGAGHREYDTIVGASVAWNQICKALSSDNYYVNNGSVSYSDGVATLTPSGTYGRIGANNDALPSIVSGHKYMIAVTCKTNFSHYFYPINADLGGGGNIGATPTANTWITYNKIFQTTSSTATRLLLGDVNVNYQSGDEVQIKNLMLIDLTLALGSTIADYIYTLEQGTAGSGVAWLKKYFPCLDECNAYDNGSIQSVGGLVSHDMMGKNLFNGSFNTMTALSLKSGTIITASAELGTASYGILRMYDSNQTFLQSTLIQVGTGTRKYSTTTLTSDISYAKFESSGGTLTDMQIEFGDTMTDYETYEKHSYPLDSTITLRGKLQLVDGKLKADGDIYPPSGEGTENYDEVSLGTLTWFYQSSYSSFTASLSGLYPMDSTDYSKGLVCSKYPSANYWWTDGNKPDKTISHGSGDVLVIKDTAYTDAPTFKQMLNDNNVKLVYKKATPTTFSADAYTSPQVCDSNGTEEYVSTSIVPVGHNTDYPMTLIDTMPTANGNYTMKLNVASGKKTITWQSV